MTGLLGVAGGVVAALLTLLGIIVGRLYVRVEALDAYSRRLWAYTRSLLDLYYRYRSPGSPDPGPLPEPGE